MPPERQLWQGLGPQPHTGNCQESCHPAVSPLRWGVCLPPRTLYRTRSCSPSRSVVPSGRISFTKAMEKIRSLLSLAGRDKSGAR